MSEDPLVSVADVAEYLDVSTATVHQWLYKNTAPKSYKVGKHRRFRWSDVEAWLEAQADDDRVGA